MDTPNLQLILANSLLIHFPNAPYAPADLPTNLHLYM